MSSVRAGRARRRGAASRLACFMRRHGWPYDVPIGGVRHRVYDLVACGHPWWDWGHRLMIVTGSDFGGNWSEPTMPTWWYHRGTPNRMARTGWPTHPPSAYEIITDYATFRERTTGLNEDQMYEWQAIGLNQDGQLHLGHQFWGGSFYGLASCDLFLLRRYLRAWRRKDWFGLRSWLYSQALHAAVYRRRPGACNQAPPLGLGGYDHWLCTLRRGHDGMHRFNAYAWGEIGGEPIGTVYAPSTKEGE